MENKTGKSKITKCEFKKSWSNAHGEFHSFWVEFEDGTKGFYNAKDKGNPKFRVGEESEYSAEVKTGKNDSKYYQIKHVQVQEKKWTGAGHKTSNSDIAGYALSYAKDLYIHGKINSIEDVMGVADDFYNWIQNKA